MSNTTLTTSRDPKGLKFVANVSAVYDKAGLDDERAQRLNESPEFIEGLRELIQQWSATNQFADEEVESTYGYLSGYTTPKPIADQGSLLREFFPELGAVDESVATSELPANAEGYFAIPNWQKVASTYGEAVQKVLDLIKQTRDGAFCNYREGRIGQQYLRQHIRTVERFQQLAKQQQGHDILVVPAQFGLTYRGCSVRRAREMMAANEFGLGAFQVGVMLLTHPERLQHLDDLWIDCGGDEYAPDADDDFSRAPYFRFDGDRVWFGTSGVDNARGGYGSASGVCPH